MPAFASIVINDGESTPVAHTFAPQGIKSPGGKTVATFEDRAGGVIVGYHRLRSEVTDQNVNGLFKLRFILEYATLETLSNNTSSGINPAPTLAYTTTGTVEIWISRRSTTQERKNVHTLLKNLLANSGVQSVIENIEAYY